MELCAFYPYRRDSAPFSYQAVFLNSRKCTLQEHYVKRKNIISFKNNTVYEK